MEIKSNKINGANAEIKANRIKLMVQMLRLKLQSLWMRLMKT